MKNKKLVIDIVDLMGRFHNWGIDHLSGSEEFEKYMNMVNELAGLADSVNEGKYDNN